MKLFEHSHTGNSMYSYMELLSTRLNAPMENNTIQVPVSMGNGFIKHCPIEDGICLRYYHFSLHNDLEFNWLADDEKSEPVFKLVFFLEATPGNRESFISGKTNHYYKEENSTILYSTDFIRTGIIKQGTVVNRMVLLFTKNWLQVNFSEASELIFNTINMLLYSKKPTFIMQEMDRSHYIFAYELAKELRLPNFPLIHIKTRALTLLNNFLDKVVASNSDNVNIDQTLYYPEITKVETVLRQSFDKPMPSISKMASEFNLSSSTLKRHFKMVYGKTIQTYYLANKMAIGKALIIAKSKTISEIAYTLGYTKVNSFSKAFKKQYGLLPKEVNIHSSSF